MEKVSRRRKGKSLKKIIIIKAIEFRRSMRKEVHAFPTCVSLDKSAEKNLSAPFVFSFHLILLMILCYVMF